MIEFDKGPLQPFARIFAACPDYGELKRHFWYDWGPIFHRGRTNGSARVLCIASDPGATERIAARTLVGDAGQRVQGFLAKLGLTRSYLLLNAFSYALIPSQASQGDNVLSQRSEEHTSELQSLMRISYAVFCLKKKTNNTTNY